MRSLFRYSARFYYTRFHWLTAKRSAVIQTSAVHAGRCTAPDDIVEHLLARTVRAPTAK